MYVIEKRKSVREAEGGKMGDWALVVEIESVMVAA